MALSARRRLLLRSGRNRERTDLVGELDSVEASTGRGPVLGCKLKVAVARPLTEHAEKIAHVSLGIEAMQPRRGDERKQVAGAG